MDVWGWPPSAFCRPPTPRERRARYKSQRRHSPSSRIRLLRAQNHGRPSSQMSRDRRGACRLHFIILSQCGPRCRPPNCRGALAQSAVGNIHPPSPRIHLPLEELSFLAISPRAFVCTGINCRMISVLANRSLRLKYPPVQRFRFRQIQSTSLRAPCSSPRGSHWTNRGPKIKPRLAKKTPYIETCLRYQTRPRAAG